MLNEDCYRLLEVAPDADEKTIRKAYRDRSKALHPDVNPSPDAAVQFARLNQAVNILLDPVQRLKHDDRFGYTKKGRNQSENSKQRFSDFQKNKAEHLVKEWSDDYGKAMAMRDKQRQEVIAAHKRRIKILSAVTIILLIATAVTVILLFVL